MSRMLALKITPKKAQPANAFYALQMSAQTLAKIAYVPVRDPKERKGIQRLTDEKRIEEIAEYIKGEGAIFPNSIIVNFTSDIDVKAVEGLPNLCWLEVPIVPKTAIIIDGQHRLLGIERSALDLEVLVTAFLKIPVPRQAAIFRDINFFQRKVNKSLMYDLFHVTKDAEYALMRAIDLTERLNEDGPLEGHIKLTGVGIGVVTQTIFVETIQQFLQTGGVFREPEYDGEGSLETQFQVLREYFASLKYNYSSVWEEPRSYVLLKTQGIYACLMLLQDLLWFFLKQHERKVPTARDFEPFIKALSKKITFDREEYGDPFLGSGGQRRLHFLLLRTLDLPGK